MQFCTISNSALASAKAVSWWSDWHIAHLLSCLLHLKLSRHALHTRTLHRTESNEHESQYRHTPRHQIGDLAAQFVEFRRFGFILHLGSAMHELPIRSTRESIRRVPFGPDDRLLISRTVYTKVTSNATSQPSNPDTSPG